MRLGGTGDVGLNEGLGCRSEKCAVRSKKVGTPNSEGSMYVYPYTISMMSDLIDIFWCLRTHCSSLLYKFPTARMLFTKRSGRKLRYQI